MSAAVYGEKFYVIGGYCDSNGSKYRTNKVEVYNTLTDSWETVSCLSIARAWSGGTVLNDDLRDWWRS
ncbi:MULTISPECIES: kelch repeat-containing protein [Paenibacillus]|uniref:kelch repeat-containing protein n=1 Tax=Paenibacillus TaxID=44249 RepID=UPI000DA19F1A